MTLILVCSDLVELLKQTAVDLDPTVQPYVKALTKYKAALTNMGVRPHTSR